MRGETYDVVADDLESHTLCSSVIVEALGTVCWAEGGVWGSDR